jgi:hypothetical protein
MPLNRNIILRRNTVRSGRYLHASSMFTFWKTPIFIVPCYKYSQVTMDMRAERRDSLHMIRTETLSERVHILRNTAQYQILWKCLASVSEGVKCKETRISATYRCEYPSPPPKKKNLTPYGRFLKLWINDFYCRTFTMKNINEVPLLLLPDGFPLRHIPIYRVHDMIGFVTNSDYLRNDRAASHSEWQRFSWFVVRHRTSVVCRTTLAPTDRGGTRVSDHLLTRLRQMLWVRPDVLETGRNCRVR